MDPRLREAFFPATVGGEPQGVTVRRFLDLDIDKAVFEALERTPADVHSVSLDVDFSGKGAVRGVMAARLRGNWSVGLVGEWKPNADWSGGFRIRKEFR